MFNFLGALISIKVAYQKPIFRVSERISVSDNISVKLYDESEKGVGILLDENSMEDLLLERNSNIKLNLLDNSFKCIVCRVDKNILGLKFKKLTPKEMKIIMIIFTKYMRPYYDNKKIQNYIVIDKFYKNDDQYEIS